MWVNSCTSFSLQNVCNAGGTTQQAARLICAMAGRTRAQPCSFIRQLPPTSAMPSWRTR
ncbi:unnamed protein product, partial [Plutella xylostella]